MKNLPKRPPRNELLEVLKQSTIEFTEANDALEASLKRDPHELLTRLYQSRVNLEDAIARLSAANARARVCAPVGPHALPAVDWLAARLAVSS